ncbi:hypothetical protein FI667_g14879, partial [Globisporangium splendens]
MDSDWRNCPDKSDAHCSRIVYTYDSKYADIEEMLRVAAEKNVRPIIQKLPMSRANEGIRMVRDGTVRCRVTLEN